MRRLILDQIRHRPGRAAALAAGILVAAVSFSLLTAATATQTAQVTGTVQRNLRPAYDILVRPKGSETALEQSQGLVRDNYLSGIFGGITMAQYQAIKKTPGVEIAAPIAMIGYVLETVDIPIDVTAALTNAPAQVLTFTDTRVAEGGLTRFPIQAEGYIYVTPDKLVSQEQMGVPITVTPGATVGDNETLPDGSTVTVCPEYTEAPSQTSPFADYQDTQAWCASRANGYGGLSALPTGHVGAYLEVTFPFLLAAIDPTAEQDLVGLAGAVVKGRYLSESDQPVPTSGLGPEVNVLATTDPYDDDQDVITVDSLPSSAVSLAREGLSPDQLAAALAKEPATPVLQTTITSTAAYDQLLTSLSRGSAPLDAYWTSSGVSYTTGPGGVLAPTVVSNPDAVWQSSLYVNAAGSNFEAVPLDDSDTAFRSLTEQIGINGGSSGPTNDFPSLKSVGEFNPSKLPGFSSLSQVPMETYYPPTATGANAASRKALGDQPLLPDANIAGYLQEPPLLLTTLSSLSAFASEFPTGDWSAPISSVRVRVGGVHGTVQQQLDQIASVAAAIQKATGLQVDITAGSSPTSETISLPAGKYGQPALLLDESWVKKAVALVIVAALDRKSVALFALILVVTALFLANASMAAVGARRGEIGVLRCLGWPRAALFRLILGELLLLGVLAGLAGTALSAALIAGLRLQLPLWRVLLITPVALALAGLAGLPPAWLATRGQPLDAVQPAVIRPRRRARPVRRISGLAWSNLRRRPRRAVLAGLALGLGIAALTVLLAINLAFSQQVTGSVLGTFVSGEVRGVDYLSAALAIGLGVASVADVLYLNLHERAPEVAALAATGWRRRDLTRVAVYEGAGIGLLGSLAGGAVGFGLAVALGGSPLTILAVALAAIGGGIVLTLAASWAVITGVSRQPIASTLAEE
jgi:ABC-type lipoprotein release transport system permease subunit